MGLCLQTNGEQRKVECIIAFTWWFWLLCICYIRVSEKESKDERKKDREKSEQEKKSIEKK